MNIRKIGLTFIALSILISLNNFVFTGAAIGASEQFLNPYISLFFLIIGFLMVREDSRKSGKNDLEILAWLPNECLTKGAARGGWDPYEQVIPGFDPQKISPEKVRKGFNIDKENRVLVRFKGKSKDAFYERKTGPENNHIGIYASQKYIPASDIEKVNESQYNRATYRP